MGIINPSKAFAIAIAPSFFLISSTYAASVRQPKIERDFNTIAVGQRRVLKSRTKVESGTKVEEETSNVQLAFPLNIEYAAFLDLSTGKSIPMKISQEENGELRMISKNEEFSEISVPPETILEWRIGDNTQQTFDGVQATSAGAGFALGAIIGGGPAAPLLLLMSPLVGMAQGNRIMPEWRIGMSRIIENGREQNLLVQTYSQESATKLGQALKISTGLDAGVRRSKDEVSLLKSSLAGEMLNKLEDFKRVLLISDKLKPWCSYVDLNTSSPERSKYLEQKQLVIDLYSDLEIEYEPDESDQSEAKWSEYLELHPHMKKWAEANPEAAESHKSCKK